MAYVSAMQPDARWRTPRSSWSTSKMHAWPANRLRQGFRSDLPLDVHVTFVTLAKDQHAVYHMTVSSAVTRRVWTISYRYSEFCAFRDVLEAECTCHDDQCRGSCRAVRECCRECFPRKRWLGSASHHAIQERKHKFESLLLHLIRTVMLPGNALKCPVARRNLPRLVFRFLQVTNKLDRRSVLQMYVDDMQSMLKESTSFCPTNTFGRASLTSTASTVSFEDAASCVICVDEDEDPVAEEPSEQYCCEHDSDATIVLPCHHAFHRECIFDWLLFEFTCPLCRMPVGPKANTWFCCPGTQTQWWLGSFHDYAVVTRPSQY